MTQNAISDARIATVKKTFLKLDRDSRGSLPLDFLIANYNADLHPRVRTREKTAQQVQAEFETAISSRAKDGFVSELDFLDYYADVSSCLPTEREDHFHNVLFADQILHSTWAPKGTKGDVTSSARILDIEIKIFEKIRQLTLPKQNEGTTLRKKFGAIDKFGLGIIDFIQFRQAMHELGFCFPDEDLRAVFYKFTGGSERLIYAELCDYFRDLGVGVPQNLNPAYTVYRKTPDDTIERISKELKSRGNLEISKLRKVFETNDKDRSGFLTRDEFVWALKEFGITLSKTEYEKVFRHFDRNFDNKVSYAEFVGAFIRELAQSRREHASDLFVRLAGAPDALLTANRISQCFDPRSDPEVQTAHTGASWIHDQEHPAQRLPRPLQEQIRHQPRRVAEGLHRDQLALRRRR